MQQQRDVTSAAAGYGRWDGVLGCHLNGRRQRDGRVRPQRNGAGVVAEERDVGRRRRLSRGQPIHVHGAGSVRHRFRAVPGHRGHDRGQRAGLHRRVPGPKAPAPVQLPARVVGRIRLVRGPARHAHGAALPDLGQMAVRHVRVRPLGT